MFGVFNVRLAVGIPEKSGAVHWNIIIYLSS